MILSENILKLMSAVDRRRYAAGQLTTTEAVAKSHRRLERQEQAILANWLLARTNDGLLTYNWSATHRKATNRKGTPDFIIYREGRFLPGEMKLEGGRLSEAQAQMHAEFARSGTAVEIWTSADLAIRRIKNWLWTHWRLWSAEPNIEADSNQ